MKVGIFTSYFSPAFLGGGPVRTLTAMLRHSPPEFETAVIASNRDMGSIHPLEVETDRWVPYDDSIVFYSRPESLFSFYRAIHLLRRWQPDAIYVNSFFDPRFSILPQMLYLIGILRPAIFAIAPRGEFDMGALSLKAKKKNSYIRLFTFIGLARRVVWHVSTLGEADNVRKIFGAKARVIVRENDTDLPPLSTNQVPKTNNLLKVVSLSRIAPKKGIDTLLEGLNEVKEEVEVDIIGPAEDREYYERCLHLASKLPDNVRVNFRGAVKHEDIRQTLANYDVMACPTKGENFGHVIAEALSVKCPVLCADVTPWTKRLDAGGGVVVSENTPAGWARALADYAQLTSQEILNRRLSAGAAYDEWKNASKEPHFFLLLQKELIERE